jgi:RimJ/RimL family protein N-acetyltransferase
MSIDKNLFQGKRVHLTRLTRDDSPAMALWTHDTGYLRLQDTEIAAMETPEEVAAFIDRENESSTAYLFGIHRNSDEALIGTVGLFDIAWGSRTAWVGVGIGRREDWSKGYGSEAMELVIQYAFDELNLHRLQLTVIDYNPRAIGMYEKLGFVREGNYREFIERDGARHDLLLYGLLRPEWRLRLGEHA